MGSEKGLEWWELDMTYAVIRVLSVLGLAYSLKLPRLKPATPSGSFGLAEHPGEHQRT
jgi:hypothetical protein